MNKQFECTITHGTFQLTPEKTLRVGDVCTLDIADAAAALAAGTVRLTDKPLQLRVDERPRVPGPPASRGDIDQIRALLSA